MALETRQASNSGGLGDLAALLGMFTGKEQTTQTKLSQTAMNQMLQSAFEKNGGLSAVSSGQRGAGMYNSSTNQLLTNDLISRLTAETAQRGAPTTVSSPAAINPLIGLAGLGVLQAFSKKSKAGEAVASGVGASSSGVGAEAVTGTAGAANTGNFISDTLSNIGSLFSGGIDSLGGALGLGGGSSTPDFQPTSINAINAGNVGNIDALMSAANFYGTDALSQQTKQLIGQDFFGEGVGTDMGLGSVPWAAGLGNLAQGDLGGAIGSVGLGTIGNWFGTALSPVLGPLGGIFGALLGSLFGN